MKEEFTAVDMATAAAQAFRDGVASVEKSEIPNNQGASAAQSAPAGEREAYEHWKAGMEPYGFGGLDAFQAGAAWQRTQSSGVLEGYVLVPKSMWVDAASIEALAFVMGGPEEDDGSPTYCDCVMWVGEIDDDGVKRHGIHVYNTECEEEGSTTLAEFAAAPAQGHQVDHIEQDLGMAQHARDSAELRRLCAERDEAKRQVAALRQHKTDYMEAAEVTRKALESELSALKAQQEPVAWRVTGAGGLTVTPEYPKWAEDDSRLLIESLYTAPQPAPAQDVAGLPYQTLFNAIAAATKASAGHVEISVAQFKAALAAHDKQSGEVK